MPNQANDELDPLTKFGWENWCKQHRTMFCIHPDNKAFTSMLALMEVQMRMLLVTAEELDEASVWMWKDPALASSPWEAHFGTLRRRILQRRADAKKAGETLKHRSESEAWLKERGIHIGKIGNPEEAKP